MKKTHKSLKIAFITLIFMLISSMPALASDYKMMVSHYTITDASRSGIAASMLYFENMVETRSNGAIDVVVKGNSALGAKAVPMPWGDLTTALASGVADGQFNAPYVNAFAKF